MSARETSVDGLVVGTGVGTDNVSHWRKVLAAFIAQSSAALAHPYFYIIRTNTKWSLCLLSGLSPTIYSTLLLKCDLVEIHTSRDGSKSVRLAREKLIEFINQYGLRGVMQSTPMAKSITVRFLIITMMLWLRVRSHEGCHYFVLAKYVRENPRPPIQINK